MQTTLKKACKRFNAAARKVGSGKRMHFTEGDIGWPWSVTTTDKTTRDHETRGFSTEHKAITFVSDAATMMEVWTQTTPPCREWVF